MRIALVSTNYFPVTCGVGDHTMRLAQHLQQLGHDVRVFCSQPAQHHEEAPSVDVEPVRAPTPALLAARLGVHIARYAPDLAVLAYTPMGLGAGRFGSVGMPALAAALRARGMRVRAIVHEAYTPRSARPDLLVGGALMRAEFLALTAAAEKTFLTTESRLDHLRDVTRVLGLSSRLDLLPVGANALPTSTTRVPLRLGTFSTLSFGKRIDVVLRAFERVAEAFPSSELWLLGDYGAGRAKVEKLIADHPASSRITVRGKLSLREVSDAIASLGVYLFPMDTGANTRSGTLPTALGSGVPVVATRGHETSSAFVDGENVVFASALDGDAFGEAALRLLNHPALASKVGRGGQLLYERELAWPRAVERILDGVGP